MVGTVFVKSHANLTSNASCPSSSETYEPVYLYNVSVIGDPVEAMVVTVYVGPGNLTTSTSATSDPDATFTWESAYTTGLGFAFVMMVASSFFHASLHDSGDQAVLYSMGNVSYHSRDGGLE